MPPKSTPQRPALSPARKKPSVLDDLGETFDDFLKVRLVVGCGTGPGEYI